MKPEDAVIADLHPYPLENIEQPPYILRIGVSIYFKEISGLRSAADLMAPLSGGSDGVVIVAEALHNEIQNARLRETLAGVCEYVWTSHLASTDQPRKIANPARGQLNRENEYLSVSVRA